MPAEHVGWRVHRSRQCGQENADHPGKDQPSRYTGSPRQAPAQHSPRRSTPCRRGGWHALGPAAAALQPCLCHPAPARGAMTRCVPAAHDTHAWAPTALTRGARRHRLTLAALQAPQAGAPGWGPQGAETAPLPFSFPSADESWLIRPIWGCGTIPGGNPALAPSLPQLPACVLTARYPAAAGVGAGGPQQGPPTHAACPGWLFRFQRSRARRGLMFPGAALVAEPS